MFTLSHLGIKVGHWTSVCLRNSLWRNPMQALRHLYFWTFKKSLTLLVCDHNLIITYHFDKNKKKCILIFNSHLWHRAVLFLSGALAELWDNTRAINCNVHLVICTSQLKFNSVMPKHSSILRKVETICSPVFPAVQSKYTCTKKSSKWYFS